MTLVSPLADQSVFEEQEVTFECEVSKPDRTAVWFKNNIALEASEKYITKVCMNNLIIYFQ